MDVHAEEREKEGSESYAWNCRYHGGSCSFELHHICSLTRHFIVIVLFFLFLTSVFSDYSVMNIMNADKVTMNVKNLIQKGHDPQEVNS